ncbi:hypothetical protein MHU86_8343 [Fragilaria crotonensis]|nr:hypothetical protein MHU86_8343 [Fragilaria crotonensis]
MNHPNAGRQIVLPEPGDVGTMILRGAAGFARRNKVIAGSYLFGIIVLLMMGSGARLTMEQRRKYNSIMDTIDLQAEFEASKSICSGRCRLPSDQGMVHM